MLPVTPLAVILPGAGSSSGFVERAFGKALREAGYGLVTPSPVPGPGVVAAALRALDEASATHGPALRLVGGVSLGAHLAARWALTRPELAGVLLVLPAWTGDPGAVAAATAASADTIDRLGTAGARAAAGDAVPWVAAELAAAWPGYGDQLAASLRAAAAAPGPSRAELASLPVPAGLVAFADDPLHPYGVAQEWAATVPRGARRTLHLADAAADPAVLGRAALAALTAAHPG
jgi:pimeloyl-ACP methyl ester carboxylesterase